MTQPSFSRRFVLGAVAAAPFASTLASAATSSVGRIMVQGRPQDTGSLYKLKNIMPALDKLGGVRKMRCREPFSGTAGWSTYVGLAREGVKFVFTLSVRDISRSVADLKAFLAVAPGSILAIEGPNEPDLNPVTYSGVTDKRLGFRTGAAPALMAYLKDFAAAASVDPVLRSIPRIASNDYMQGAQAKFVNYGNTHIYPTIKSDVAARFATFKTALSQGGYSQGMITEWGRTTGGGASNATAAPVTQAQQAQLLASDIAAALARPYVHTFTIYELFSWGGTSEMNNFGIFNADLSPRPAVAAIREVIT